MQNFKEKDRHEDSDIGIWFYNMNEKQLHWIQNKLAY